MKVNRPGDPVNGVSQPLDPRDAQNVAKGERFEAVLSEVDGQTGGAANNTTIGATRAALAQIAGGADLTDAAQSLVAVRESARYMIRMRLKDKYRRTKEGERVVEGLSEYVASDPLLKSKLLSILIKIKPV